MNVIFISIRAIGVVPAMPASEALPWLSLMAGLARGVAFWRRRCGS
jgi:hypothetical protein